MLHHLHLRKRMYKLLEPYPAKSFKKRLLDKLVFLFGIIGPITSLPQIVLIYGGHNATGVSSLSWFTWTILDIPWIFYGIMHKEPPITVTYCLWFICNLFVFIGALIY